MPTQARGQRARDRILDAAITRMRRGGFHGAGINDILGDSGAPKGSLYHFFPAGKQQVASEAIARYAERVIAYIDESMSGPRDPAAKVRALFRAVALRFEAAGGAESCAAGAAALDLDPELDTVRSAIRTMFDRCVDTIATHLAMRDLRRRRSFASLILTTIEGAYIRARAEGSARPIEEGGRWLAEMVQRESTQPNQGRRT